MKATNVLVFPQISARIKFDRSHNEPLRPGTSQLSSHYPLNEQNTSPILPSCYLKFQNKISQLKSRQSTISPTAFSNADGPVVCLNQPTPSDWRLLQVERCSTSRRQFSKTSSCWGYVTPIVEGREEITQLTIYCNNYKTHSKHASRSPKKPIALLFLEEKDAWARVLLNSLEPLGIQLSSSPPPSSLHTTTAEQETSPLLFYLSPN